MPKSHFDTSTGASYFFTVSLLNRHSDLLIREIDSLRASYISALRTRPFICDAFVVLPDHLHAVWTLPSGDNDVSTRWQVLKAQFTSRIRQGSAPSLNKTRGRPMGLWRHLYRKHKIRDEKDFAACVERCWTNSVTHGLATSPREWPYSSLHRDIRRGVVPPDWSGGGVITKGEGATDGRKTTFSDKYAASRLEYR